MSKRIVGEDDEGMGWEVGDIIKNHSFLNGGRHSYLQVGNIPSWQKNCLTSWGK
jgi:hypothetical protein